MLGFSRPGASPLRKAPPDSSPGAPSSPLRFAVLTGFPQLPPHGRSTSRSRSVRRCDSDGGVTHLPGRSPLRVLPPLGLHPFSPCRKRLRRDSETSAHGVSAKVSTPSSGDWAPSQRLIAYSVLLGRWLAQRLRLAAPPGVSSRPSHPFQSSWLSVFFRCRSLGNVCSAEDWAHRVCREWLVSNRDRKSVV